MSTSATHPGTTTRAPGSGKGLGIAAGVLAVVIAAGFVFAVNQGNEPSVGNVDARLAEPAFQAEADRYTGLAENWIRNDPENWPSELKRIYEMIAAAEARNYPGTNPEQTRMANSGELSVAPAGSEILQQRLVHEFFESRRTPQSTDSNPLERIAR